MSVNGIDIVRGVYRRLRRPAQSDLAWQDVLAIVGEVVARMKYDLMMSPQGDTAKISDWFVPSSTDFALGDVGIQNCLLPTRVEKKGLDSEFETGADVPCVAVDVLDTSNVGAVAFYGSPLRMAFCDPFDYVTQMQYRVVFQTDTVDGISLSTVTGLPNFFQAKAILDAAYQAMEICEDQSAEWLSFVKMYRPDWGGEMKQKNQDWIRYVRKFRGKSQIPKTRFWDNRGVRAKTGPLFGTDPNIGNVDGGTP